MEDALAISRSSLEDYFVEGIRSSSSFSAGRCQSQERMRFNTAATILLLMNSFSPAATMESAEAVHKANVAAAAARHAISDSAPLGDALSGPNKRAGRTSKLKKKRPPRRTSVPKPSSSKKKKARVFSATLKDEMVRTIAMVCMDIVFSKGDMKVGKQERLLAELYHGNQETGKS